MVLQVVDLAGCGAGYWTWFKADFAHHPPTISGSHRPGR